MAKKNTCPVIPKNGYVIFTSFEIGADKTEAGIIVSTKQERNITFTVRAVANNSEYQVGDQIYFPHAMTAHIAVARIGGEEWCFLPEDKISGRKKRPAELKEKLEVVK